MAEQMVLEMMAASARIQDAALVLRRLQSQEKNFRARFPWEKFARLRSGAGVGGSPVRNGSGLLAFGGATRADDAAGGTSLPSDGKVQPRAAELFALEPTAYLERIRLMAYNYWEAAGQRYGQALDYWLRAEQEILNTMVTAAEPVAALKAHEAATNDEPSAPPESHAGASANHRALA